MKVAPEGLAKKPLGEPPILEGESAMMPGAMLETLAMDGLDRGVSPLEATSSPLSELLHGVDALLTGDARGLPRGAPFPLSWGLATNLNFRSCGLVSVEAVEPRLLLRDGACVVDGVGAAKVLTKRVP